MLVQFIVENYLSFDAKTVFNFTATSSDTQHPDHVLMIGETSKIPPLLRCAAIYGANAAGKSNLVKAIAFAKSLILEGTGSGKSISVIPFRLSAEEGRPSRFEFIFVSDGILYSYGFVLNSKRILEEWLYTTPKRNEVPLFERVTSKNNEVQVDIGPLLTGKSKGERQFLEFVARGTRYNQLFLTEADDRNVTKLKPIIDWFKNVLLVIPADANHLDLENRVHGSAHLTDFISSLLRIAGTGIERVTSEEIFGDIDNLFMGMPGVMQDEIASRLSKAERHGLTITAPSGERHFLTRRSDGQCAAVLLKTQHLTEDGRMVEFAMIDESEGTQRLVHLAPALFELEGEQERVIVLDELDRRLHPLLSRLLVETALDCSRSGMKSQLIFTTHETSLLDLDLLRRDEIWFVEKDRCGASHLYSLAEFKIRPDLVVQKGYLKGRFGAIPFIGNLCDLGWTDEKESAEKSRADPA